MQKLWGLKVFKEAGPQTFQFRDAEHQSCRKLKKARCISLLKESINHQLWQNQEVITEGFS